MQFGMSFKFQVYHANRLFGIVANQQVEKKISLLLKKKSTAKRLQMNNSTVFVKFF